MKHNANTQRSQPPGLVMMRMKRFNLHLFHLKHKTCDSNITHCHQNNSKIIDKMMMTVECGDEYLLDVENFKVQLSNEAAIGTSCIASFISQLISNTIKI